MDRSDLTPRHPLTTKDLAQLARAVAQMRAAGFPNFDRIERLLAEHMRLRRAVRKLLHELPDNVAKLDSVAALRELIPPPGT